MSTDYFIFLNSDQTSSENIYKPMLDVPGVEFRNGLHIRGLFDVSCKQIDNYYREVMREDYGEFGLDVNWLIRGTYDNETDIFELIRLLYECAAKLVNSNPDKPLGLMRNGESIYLFNSQNRLILSPLYLESIPVIKTFFNKPLIIAELSY